MSGTGFSIRPATQADARDIAALHVAVSRATYRDLAPPEAAARLNFDHRLARWQETLAKGERTALVAEANDRIVGIGTAGAPTVPALQDHAEVLHLYVDPMFAGRGIGRALLRALALAMRAEGHRSLGLGVVDGNDAAVAFYEKLGGRAAGFYTDPGPIWRSRNRIIVWDDIEALLARTQSGF